MTILLINYPSLKSYIDDKWLEGLWTIDTDIEDAVNNLDTYNPDYIICSNKREAEHIQGFWHKDEQTIRDIIDGIT